VYYGANYALQQQKIYIFFLISGICLYEKCEEVIKEQSNELVQKVDWLMVQLTKQPTY